MRDELSFFAKFVNWSVHVTGSLAGFGISLTIVIVWLLSGPYFQWSDGWQLSINTGTTIVTFLMVFLIQNSQNRHAKATQLKLDELIKSIALAKNAIINVERLSEREMDILLKRYEKLGDSDHTEHTDMGPK